MYTLIHTYIRTYIHTWLKPRVVQAGCPGRPASEDPPFEHSGENHTSPIIEILSYNIFFAGDLDLPLGHYCRPLRHLAVSRSALDPGGHWHFNPASSFDQNTERALNLANNLCYLQATEELIILYDDSQPYFLLVQELCGVSKVHQLDLERQGEARHALPQVRNVVAL